METQNQIKRVLTRPDSIEYIHGILDSTDDLNRTQLADHLCEKFKFFNSLGQVQRSGCLKAIRELEGKGHFNLPKPTRIIGKKSPRRLNESVPEPQGVPDKVGKIKELRLVLVEKEQHIRIWNELMIQDHPQATGIFCGHQVKYLVESEHGWLGGLGFSSAALNLEDRDKWIGWDKESRNLHLHKVINMSRFLIRSSVKCRNLASRVLGMAIRQFSKDFEKRYSYRPLLIESFVDTLHYIGTSYKAANFKKIGSTKGRGRNDTLSKKTKSIKDIYVYPLIDDFRIQFGIQKDTGLEAIEISSGIDGKNWAQNEFMDAPLGDKRLTARLIQSAMDKGENPSRAYSGIAGGDWPKVKGYYRMIDQPDDSAVTMENILLPHRKRTVQRMKGQNTVLCIQDGSDLNYSNLDQCKGLGVIGTNQTSAKTKGLHLHSTIAVTTDGLPLGIIRAECSAPEIKEKKDPNKSVPVPIEQKKTFCWIESLRDCAVLKDQMSDTTLVNVMDREGDFFELFDDHRRNSSSIDLLVRAQYDRKTTENINLFELVRQSQVKAQIKIMVPRQSARAKKSKQKARPKRPMRTAEVSIHYRQVELNPPSTFKGRKNISLRIICVREMSPPKDTEPLEWFLLTSIELKSAYDAIECVRWYCLRWRIEDWHRVLKSGCKVEKVQHKTAERLKRSLAINMVIGWRIMLMTLLGREVPELPPEVMFTDLEISVLTAYAKKKNSNYQNV